MDNEEIIKEKLEAIKKHMYEELKQLRFGIAENSTGKSKDSTVDDVKAGTGNIYIQKYKSTKRQKAYRFIDKIKNKRRCYPVH